MGSIILHNKEVARRKGWKAAVTTVAGVALAASGAPLFGVPVVVAGAYFGWDWFMFRARNGLRF